MQNNMFAYNAKEHSVVIVSRFILQTQRGTLSYVSVETSL
jgi:hypothetical protein